MDEFDRRLAMTRAMASLSPDEIQQALGVPPGEGGLFEIAHTGLWDEAVLDTSQDRPEIDRLAVEVAARLSPYAPSGTSVWARHGVVVIQTGESQSWTDFNQMHCNGVEPAVLVRIALQHAQDEFTELLAWPWPGDTTDFAEPEAQL